MEPVDIVREGYARYARGDFAGVFELLAENITIWQSDLLPWGGEHSGHAGARKFFGMIAEHTTAVPEPVAFVPAGNHVAVYGKLRGMVRATGIEFDMDIVHLWQVTNGKIDRFEAFIDTPRMLEVLGR